MICGCPLCTAKYRPEEKPTVRDCIGSWQYRYTAPDGREKALNRPTYDEAVADGQREATKARDGNWIDPDRSKITIGAWWDIWWPLQRVDDATRARDGSLYRNHIEPHFGHWKLSAVGHLDLQAWVNGLDGPLAPSSVGSVFAIMRRMCKSALLDRRIPFTPADGVTLPKIRKKHPADRRPPSYAQLRLIRRELPRAYFPLQTLAQETGLRWGELAGLRACNVDLDSARIEVREVITEVRGVIARKAYPKSSAGLRTVPLTPLAVRVLRAHMDAEQPLVSRTSIQDGLRSEELVFHGLKRSKTDDSGAEWAGRDRWCPLWGTSARIIWREAAERAGVSRVVERVLPSGKIRREHWPHFHDQRHAYASRLHGLGVPEAIVQEVLGHERAGDVTWLYTHAAADVAGQVYAALTDRQRAVRPHLRAVA